MLALRTTCICAEMLPNGINEPWNNEQEEQEASNGITSWIRLLRIAAVSATGTKKPFHTVYATNIQPSAQRFAVQPRRVLCADGWNGLFGGPSAFAAATGTDFQRPGHFFVIESVVVPSARTRLQVVPFLIR